MTNHAISVFDGVSDVLAAQSMRQVDATLSEYLERYGYIIGTYGVKFAVQRTDGLPDTDRHTIHFTAYSYAD